MGTPTWQRQLLETLTRLESGQREVVGQLTQLNSRVDQLEHGQREVVGRLDNMLRITGGHHSALEERVRRIEERLQLEPPTR